MKPSPHGEQARLPLAAGRIAAAAARNSDDKAGTKVAPPGLFSVFDRDKDSSQVNTSGVLRWSALADWLALYSGLAAVLGAIRAKSEVSSFS